MAKKSPSSKQADPNRQLTIRLDPTTIESLDEMALSMQKTAAQGMKLTRTDALRAAILSGIKTFQGSQARKR